MNRLSRRRNRIVPATTFLIAGLILAGCSAGDSGSEPVDDTGSEPTEDAGSETIEVETEFGPATLPAEPQAALGMYTTDIDMLITLGYPLAGSQPIRGDNDYDGFPYYLDQDALNGVEDFVSWPEFNYERIAQAEPDFILNSLGYDEESVARLPDIAPTFSFDGFAGDHWRVHFDEVATQLDRTEQRDEWVQEYDAKIEEAQSQLAELLATDAVISPVGYTEGEFGFVCWATCYVLEDLGFEVDPLAGNHLLGEAGTVSLESADELSNIDIAIVFVEPTGENSLEHEDLQGNALWEDLSFVENDYIVGFNRELLYGSPSADLALIDELLEGLLAIQAEM